MFDLTPIAHYYLAIGSGVDILRDAANQANIISGNWDAFWNATYQQTNGLWLSAIYFADLLVKVLFLSFAISFFKSVFSNRWRLAAENYLWTLIAIILLSNNGQLLIPAIKAMRYVAVDRIQVVYQINIGSVAVEQAIKDILITSTLKQQIARSFRACQAKTGSQQIECVIDAGQDAERRIQDANRQWGVLAGLIRLQANVVSAVSNFLNNPSIGGVANLSLGGPYVGSLAQVFIHYLLKLFQWAFIHLFELSLALTGLYCPIAVALSTIPNSQRYLYYWVISFLSIAVGIWSYALIVGTIAWVIVSSGTQTTTDTGFLLLIGVLAPVISAKLAMGGGIAIWNGIIQGIRDFIPLI